MDQQEFQELVVDLILDPPSLEHWEKLSQLCSSNEIRDFQWCFSYENKSYDLYMSVFSTIKQIIKPSKLSFGINPSSSSLEISSNLFFVWNTIISCPEMNIPVAVCAFDQSSIDLFDFVEYVQQIVMSRNIKTSDSSTPKVLTNRVNDIATFLHWMYQNNVAARAKIRSVIGHLLLLNNRVYAGMDSGFRRIHVGKFLELLYNIIQGFPKGSLEHRHAYVDILKGLILPLHLPNDMIEWRDQIPSIQPYHETLMKCCKAIISHCDDAYRSTIVQTLVSGLFQSWPPTHQANTAKEVLLIHELESLLAGLKPDDISLCRRTILDRWCRCLELDSNNIRIVQRATQIFKNDKIIGLFISTDPDQEDFFLRMIPTLYRGGELNWNPTVNKMSGLALKKMRDINMEVFQQVSNRLWKCSAMAQHKTRKLDSSTKPSEMSTIGVSEKSSALRSSSSMLPPTHAMSSRVQPVSLPTRNNNHDSSPQGLFSDWKPSQGAPPPVTVTGVAPWAINRTPSAEPKRTSSSPMTIMPGSSLMPPRGALTAPPLPRRTTKASSEDQRKDSSNSLNRDKETALDVGTSVVMECGYDKICEFITICVPSNVEEDPSLQWKKEQAALTPTLLPHLKFHDLVFGHELGKGAFSTVKYARTILPEKSRSMWPEYAVKITSAACMKEHQYHRSILREMATLQLLSHPGIARLISTFRYHDAAYMVIEYASQGDLHTKIIQCGPFKPYQCQFVVGEIAAALSYLHDMDFSFNDLKPENVLITALGHVKLTDFGACRSLGESSRLLVKTSQQSLGTLRNGDWKEVQSDATSQSVVNDESSLDDEDLDLRFEGTPAYLSPEVLQHRSPPSKGSDAWALGHVTYFLSHGKPLFYGSTSDEVLQQIGQVFPALASFHSATSSSSDPVVRFDVDAKDVFSLAVGNEEAAVAAAANGSSGPSMSIMNEFILGLLDIDPIHRWNIHTAMNHAFLVNNSQSCRPENFHAGPGIEFPVADDNGDPEKAQDQLWARRQFSVLWAPMPSDSMDNNNPSDGASNNRHRITNLSSKYSWKPIEETPLERGSPFQ